MLVFPVGFMAATAAGGAAPNTVTSLAAGTATTTTIPLTWVESGGTPTTRTVTQRTPSGSGGYSSSAGTFGSTGGTVTGLTAGSAYDFQVVESNASGSSGTATLTNVSTASASGSGPNLTLTSPSYGTSYTGFGQKLTGGLGKVALTYAGGDYTVEIIFQSSSLPSTDQAVWSINNAADTTFNGAALLMHADGTPTAYFGGFTTHPAGSAANLCDGAVHHIALCGQSSINFTGLWVDGAFYAGDNYIGIAANPLLYLTPAGSIGNPQFYANGIGTIDEVRFSNICRYTSAFTGPTSPFAWDSNTLGLWHLDGNGVSA